METRSQKFAKAAFAKVEAIHKLGTEKEKFKKEYGALALGFPVMVLQSGLAQAVGFFKAKDKEHHRAYLNDLAAVIGNVDAIKLHDDVIKSNLTEYQRLTRTALDASSWFKRYAQALLKAKATDRGRE